MAASTSKATVFARTNMLGTPILASPPTVVTNEDGQLLLLTRAELNIFTPAFGIQVDTPAETASGPSIAPGEAASRNLKGKGKGKEKAAQAEEKDSQVPMFRTSIQMEKKDILDWPGWISEVQAATGGTAPGEAFWRCGTWSPTGLSSLGGCVIAGITNNNEALLFEPEKNAYKGAWKETFDLTSHLVKLVITEEDLQPADGKIQTNLDRRRLAAHLHECQATTAAWSSAVEGTYGDYSILAVGHRSGHISLWRRFPDGTMGVLHRYRMSDEAGSIPLISWSPWTLSENAGRTLALACLAVADAQGRVWSVEVTQVVTNPHVGFAATAGSEIPEENPADVWAIQPLIVCEADRRPASQFRWIPREAAFQLVFSKTGDVSVVTLEPANSSTPGEYRVKSTEVLELPTVGDWMGASGYSPCCRIEFLQQSQAILVALLDGSLHSITLDPTPAFAIDSASLPSSANLTLALRQAYDEIGDSLNSEKEKYDRRVKGPKEKEGPRLNGFAALGDDGEVAWMYEVVRPDAIIYKPDSSVRTIFLLTALFGEADAREQFRRLNALFASTLNSRTSSPLTTLRSLLHYVKDHVADHSSFSEDLRSFLQPIELPALPNATAQYVDKVETTAAFVDKLFGETMLEQLRCREAIARFMQRLPGLPRAQQHETIILHTTLARQIAREVTSRLGTLLSNSKALLGAQELAISGRILLASASLLPSRGTDLTGEEPILPPDALSTAFEDTETCPACKAGVPFANIRKAACLNGHQWERCSITLAVVASVQVRTCTGCERKALVKLVLEPPTPETRGTPASVDVVNSLLRAATCCLYCGGRWMKAR